MENYSLGELVLKMMTECFAPNIRHIMEGKKKRADGKGEDRVVTVIFEDGTHVMQKCLPDDNYDLYVGVALCLAERMFGSKNKFHKIVDARTSKPREKKPKAKEAEEKKG